MTEEVFNRLLDRVEKPARYIGGEYNMQVKDQADLRFALCFPDVYEIGMSHLGSRILYHVLNAMDLANTLPLISAKSSPKRIISEVF